MNVPHTVKPEAAIRGPVLTFTGDPFKQAPDEVMVYEPDGIVAFGGGKITHFGPAEVIEKQLPPDIEITNYGPDSLISAGFLDSHVHFPQTPMIGAFGEQLLDWLNTYTFPMERRYADKTFASAVAKMFLNECLKNGITTSCVYCTVYPQSVDALFEEADRLGMRIAGGKVMMDRNAPDYLLDTAQTSYEESKALIEKWHGHNRIMYAITPRFAPTSSPEQLAVAGALWDEQLVTLLALLYVPNPGLLFALVTCFLFGLGSSGSMLPFSSAADVVKPDQVGTSAAIVNGVSFILAGFMMSRPGVIIERGMAAGTDMGLFDIAQAAAMPLLFCAAIPVVLGFFMKESYPTQRSA